MAVRRHRHGIRMTSMRVRLRAPTISSYKKENPMTRISIVNAMLVPVLAIGLTAFLSAGCESHHEEGVTSNYHTQWTTVNANTADTTEAAKAVLTSEGLRDVSGSSTNVDGKATGKKADGTKVSVAIQKKSDTSSEVSVNVGTVGDPALGAEVARKIKDKAEAK
jgi:hypothetical protein